MTTGSYNPALSWRFNVEIDGHAIGTFTGVDGLQAEYEVDEVKEGGNNDFVHKLPTRLKFTNVKLTRAVDQQSGPMAAWFGEQQRKVARHTASITAYDGSKTVIAVWDLVGVIPLKYTGPKLDANGSTAATETLELAHHGFTTRGA